MLFRSTFLLILSSLALGGCSKYMPNLDKVLPDQRKEYQKSSSLPDLEVPPDLTTETIDDTLTVPDVDANGSATFSTYQERVVRQKEERLQPNAGARAGARARAGNNVSIAEVSGEQLIIVPRSNSDTWFTLQEFWDKNGYTLDLDDRELGIMETHWNGDETNQSRDKFKMFVEPTDDINKTAIYLSHAGEEHDQDSWRERARNIPLEQKVAISIKNAFGSSTNSTAALETTNNVSTSPSSAELAPIRAELINAGDGKKYLAVTSHVDSTWALVSDFLYNASDIEVDNESSSEGTFDIVYLAEGAAKKGIVSKLTFWKSDKNEFQISLKSIGSSTEIIVLDEDGDWQSSDQADQLLNRIKSNL